MLVLSKAKWTTVRREGNQGHETKQGKIKIEDDQGHKERDYREKG